MNQPESQSEFCQHGVYHGWMSGCRECQPKNAPNEAPDETDAVKPEQYSNPQHIRFVKDMLKAGLKPYHYRGRFYWQGPAVNVDDLQDAMSETRVKVQWDNMGQGFVVYPVAS